MKQNKLSIGILALLLFFSMSCGLGLLGKDEDTRENLSAPDSETDLSASPAAVQEIIGQPLRQWASSASASSEYGSTDWSAAQATDAPDAECGDDVRAWASAYTIGEEWLELTYYEPVIPTEIHIHQSYNASQIVEVAVVSADGQLHTVWKGQAEEVAYCPDIMTITLSKKFQFPVIGVRLWIDYDALELGWNEIDAVELVGVPTMMAEVPSAPSSSQIDNPSDNPVDISDSPSDNNANIPAPAGFLTTPKYQSLLKVIPGITQESELPALMGEKGKLSTENWKPRPDHANTYIYDLGEGVTAYVSVITSGEVYKTSISGVPQTMNVTVNQDLYDQMTALYNQDNMLPYETVANLLDSPGLLIWYQLRDDGTMRKTYLWYNAQGEYISGNFIDGFIRGSAGFAYVVE